MRRTRSRLSVVVLSIVSLVACSGSGGGIAVPGGGTKYRVSGVVSGATAEGVTIALGPWLTQTDAKGAWSFDGIAPGSYGVRPSKLGFTFSPPSRDVVVSSTDVAGQDFTAAKGPCSVAGATTVAPAGEPIAGATVTAIGNATASAVTNAEGGYVLEGLPSGIYTVTPALAGFGFSPASRVVSVSATECTIASFTGYARVKVTGKVSGDVAAGVSLVLDGGQSAISGADGAYVIDGVANGTYRLTPSLAGYAFSPASHVVTVAWADASGQDFTAVALPAGHAISGNVAASTCGGTAGVDVFLVGPVARTTSTDGSGNFTFADLPDGTYTLSPLEVYCTFTPTSRSGIVSGADLGGQDFTGTFGATYDVYGVSRLLDGSRLPFTSIELIDGAAYTTTTNTSGNYAIGNLAPGSYTATASQPGWTFSPAEFHFDIASSGLSNVDFIASSTLAAASVSGTIGGSYTDGRLHLSVVPDAGGLPVAGTSVVGAGPFTIRGVSPGTYRVHAWLERAVDGGVLDIVDPTGVSDAFTVGTGNVTGADVALANPFLVPLDAPPANVRAFPGDGVAVVTWDVAALTTAWGPRANDVTGYRISWSADCAGFAEEVTATVPVGWNVGAWFGSRFTNGASLCFRVRRLLGGWEGPPSPSAGPITIGAPPGGVSVYGAIPFGAPATTHLLWVALLGPGAAYATAIPWAMTPERYTLSGVQPGEYALFAFLDMNDDGVLDGGDQPPVLDSLPLVAVADAPLAGRNLSLPSWWTSTGVRTTHRRAGDADAWAVTLFVDALREIPVKVTLLSGEGLPLPLDLASDLGRFERTIERGATAPAIADSYAFQVEYADGTSWAYQAPVGAVIPASAMATPSAPIGAVPGQTTPTFSWTAPAAPLGSFVYRIGVADAATHEPVWSYPARGWLPGMSGSRSSIAYDADGAARLPSLASGATYEWWIAVVDPDGNEGRSYATFTP